MNPVVNTISAVSIAFGLNSTTLPLRPVGDGSGYPSIENPSFPPASPTLEASVYRALVEGHPRLKGGFNWDSAVIGSDDVLRVPAMKSGEASLAIYPDRYLSWEGAGAVSTVDFRTNEIAMASLRHGSQALSDEELSPVNRISKRLLPEIYSSCTSPECAGFEWVSHLLSAFSIARDGAGIFDAMTARLTYLMDAGVVEAIEPQRMNDIVMTRLLLARSSYLYGQALEELSLKNPDAAREWLPGGGKLAVLVGEAQRVARDLGIEFRDLDMAKALRSFNDPDYSRVAINPRYYKEGITDAALSEVSLGFLQSRILRRLSDNAGQQPDVGRMEAMLVLRRTFRFGKAFTLLPPLNGTKGEAGSDLEVLVEECVAYVRSPAFKEDWGFLSSGGTTAKIEASEPSTLNRAARK